MSASKKKKKYRTANQQGQAQLSEKTDNKTPVSVKKEKRNANSTTALLSGSWQINTLIFFLLIIFTVTLYAGDLNLGFFRIDDKQYVTDNPWIKSFSAENINYIFSNPFFANYSPLHQLSYSLDYAFGGPDAYGFHLSSNIWAGLVSGFVFLVALAFTRHRNISIAAAILFIVHPAHVEAIAWISSRKDLVAAAFVLPSLLAYMQYRKGGKAALRWYILSIVLFLFAALGKLSVATFPAVFFAIDLFWEKRNLLKSLIDKIPFLLTGAFIAMAVSSAQPASGSQFNFVILAKAFLDSLWLLTGFGDYVIFRIPPQPGEMITQIAAAVALLAVFILPLFFLRRFPITIVLIYWILFTLIPPQILSFVHPVSDRYLYLPSVAFTILISWGIINTAKRFGKVGLIAAYLSIFTLAFFWCRGTLNYLSEWKDPRSVWFGAKKKSSDPKIYYNMGWHYMDKAASLGNNPRKPRPTVEEEIQFASIVWKDDPRLSKLLAEWSGGIKNGEAEKIFQQYLREQAWNDFEKALEKKGRNMMPDFYFHRGLLQLDRKNLTGARKEFMTAIDEAGRVGFAETQQNVLVNCHSNLGIVAWTEGNYREALTWIKLAEEEQKQFGANWLPELTANRKKLEEIIASLPGK